MMLRVLARCASQAFAKNEAERPESRSKIPALHRFFADSILVGTLNLS